MADFFQIAVRWMADCRGISGWLFCLGLAVGVFRKFWLGFLFCGRSLEGGGGWSERKYYL
jgi:hypothetical protein